MKATVTRSHSRRALAALGSAALAVLVLVVWAAPARAEKGGDFEEKSAYGKIQKREYELGHEISLGWSYLPLDPYYKGYGASLSYTIHLSHLFALELFRVGFAWNLDTSLKTKLIDQMPDISPEEFPAVVFFENTNLLLKLLYGKQSFLNRQVLHWELFVTAGAAFVFRNPFNVGDLDMDNSRYEMGVNVGFGFRFWLSKSWSLRVDLRDTILLLSIKGAGGGEALLENSAEIGLGLSVNL
jgi:outer membrane beta-barrel protein